MAGTLEPIALSHIRLDEIDLEDTAFQFRLETNAGSIKQSLAAEGQLNPVSVIAREDRYRLVDGFRRTTAAKELGWAEIHAAIYPAMSDEDSKKMAFVKNVVRRNLSPLERANAMRLAQREGYELDNVAELFGVTSRTVRRYLCLPEAVLKQVDGKNITMAHGKALAQLCTHQNGETDHGLLETLVSQVRETGLSAREIAKMVVGDRPVNGRRTRHPHVTDQEVRIFGLRMTRRTTPTELHAAAAALRKAAQRLEDFARSQA